MFLIVFIERCLERRSSMAALSTAQTVMVVRLSICEARWVRDR